MAVRIFNLSKLGLKAGTYTVTVKAKGTNFRDSEPCAAMTYGIALAAPSITLDGSIVTITDNSGGEAVNFYIVVDGTIKGSTTSKTFDLSTLGLTAGTYPITVGATNEDGVASAASNEVRYTVLADLAAPTIALSGNVLTIADNSGAAENYYIVVEGEIKGTTTAKTFDLSTLGLPVGSYSVTVGATAEGYNPSPASNAVTYAVLNAVATPTISLDGTNLNIYDESGIATEFDILVDGEVKETVSATKLINFSVQGIYNCQAEDGMTWGEWVDSEYNTSSFLIENGEVCTSDFAAVRLNGTVVKDTDTIIADATYTRDEMTSG